MKPFFATEQSIAQLQYHAGLWVGTPFMPNAAVRGAGVSCQKLVAAIYAELHVIPPQLTVPEGPMNWSHANTRSLITEFMAALPQFTEVKRLTHRADEARPGDMVGFRIGGCVHHCGIVITQDGQFIHCMRDRGTLLSLLGDATYASRLEKIWRPTCP